MRRKPSHQVQQERFLDWAKDHNEVIGIATTAAIRGFPKQTVFLRGGRTAFIEFQKPGTRGLSKHQEKWSAKLKGMQFAYTVVTTAEAAVAFVETLDP